MQLHKFEEFVKQKLKFLEDFLVVLSISELETTGLNGLGVSGRFFEAGTLFGH